MMCDSFSKQAVILIRRTLFFLLFGALFVVSLPVRAALMTYQLESHPDGNASSPTYGLRLDGLFTQDTNDIWTFDFDGSGSSMMLTYDSVANDIRIYGTVLGGLDTGSMYHSSLQGLWSVDFRYSANVTKGSAGSDTFFEVTGEDPSNMGTITPLFNATGVAPASGEVIQVNLGTAISLVDEQGSHSYSFRFNNTEDHRLAGYGLSGPDTFVGWGWLNHSDQSHIYASDWLFTGSRTAVPLPAAIWLFGSGLLGLFGFGLRRRCSLT
jgi:hypothetical protein